MSLFPKNRNEQIKDEVWDRLKADKTEVYGEPIIDAFLRTTRELEKRHWGELPASKRKLVTAQCELEMAETPEEAEAAMKRGVVHLEPALAGAAKKGNVGMIEHLIGKGAKNKEYALDVAARHGRLESVKALMRAGAEPSDSALSFAASSGHADIVRHLIESKPTLDIKYALWNAASGGNIEIIDYVISKYPDLESEGKGLGEALEKATENGHIKAMRFLIDKGAKGLEPALLRSVWAGQREAMEMLLDYGADPTGTIMWASERKYYPILEVMMKRHKCLKIAKRLARDYPDVAEFLDARERFA